MTYKNIIFDVDGTLIDTKDAILHSLQDVVKTLLNKDIPLQELVFALGIPSVKALKDLGVKDPYYGERLWKEKLDNYRERITTFPGVKECLELLQKETVTLGILTSKTVKEFEEDVIPHDIAKYFTTIVTAEETVNHKPSPEPMLRYLAKTQASAKESIYIGDTIHDFDCAKNAKVAFALALWGCEDKQEFAADYRLTEPNDILKIIK